MGLLCIIGQLLVYTTIVPELWSCSNTLHYNTTMLDRCGEKAVLCSFHFQDKNRTKTKRTDENNALKHLSFFCCFFCVYRLSRNVANHAKNIKHQRRI